MELRHLRYFAAVAELLNFTKASRRLRVAQPALSRQIHDLEEDLGAPLFERGVRPIRLTEPGKAFQAETLAILQRVEEARRTVRAISRGERGEIHVGYAPSPTVELLPLILHTFQNEAPEVKVTLHDLSTEEMSRGLAEGSLHLCLMVQPEAASFRKLRFEVLREYPICAALHPKHPLARRRVVPLEQLAHEPLLAFSRAEYPEYHEAVEAAFRHLGLPPIAEEHDSGPGIIAAAEIGRGWIFAPACFSVLVGGRLLLRPLQPSPPPLLVGAAYHPQRLTGAAARFLAAARAAASGMKVRGHPAGG